MARRGSGIAMWLRCFTWGRNGESYFYSMEFIEGETLDALVKREGALDLIIALDVAAQVSNALIAAAKQNLVHRDIKPSNLMLVREGRWRNDREGH